MRGVLLFRSNAVSGNFNVQMMPKLLLQNLLNHGAETKNRAPRERSPANFNIYSTKNNLTDYRLTSAYFCAGRMSAALRVLLRRQLYLLQIE